MDYIHRGKSQHIAGAVPITAIRSAIGLIGQVPAKVLGEIEDTDAVKAGAIAFDNERIYAGKSCGPHDQTGLLLHLALHGRSGMFTELQAAAWKSP